MLMLILSPASWLLNQLVVACAEDFRAAGESPDWLRDRAHRGKDLIARTALLADREEVAACAYFSVFSGRSAVSNPTPRRGD